MDYKQEDFIYKADTSNPAVLGVLEGPVADIINPTRNGRKYSDKLWQKVFDSDIVNELLESGGIFGESQHPTDRQEVDTEKIAIALKTVGLILGGKDHASISHGVKKIEAEIKTNEALNNTVNIIKKKINPL